MKRAILALALVLAIVLPVQGEVKFRALSVTQTSQTTQFAPSSAVMICNLGASAVFFRLFVENDITAAATTSYGTIAAGSATAPVCMSFSKSPTNPANFNALSIVCDTGLTATAHVYYQ
jgi:hypothetical protein